MKMKTIVLASLLTLPAAAATWSTGTYVYDGSGNVVRIGDDQYVYDRTGRLTKGTATGTSHRQEYTYDSFGNRLSARTCVNDVCPPLVQLSMTPTTNHVQGVGYGEAGNVESDSSDGTSHHYDFDAGEMIASQTDGDGTSEYIYTANDQRIAVHQGTEWRWSVRDLSQRVARDFTSTDTAGDWTAVKDYVHSNRGLAGILSAAGRRHAHLDHLGTPRLLTAEEGHQVGLHTYYPFGEELPSATESPEERLKFTGHERDDSGLDYMHARYYGAGEGRFLSVDPKLNAKAASKYPQLWNRYSYAEDNPLKFTDPTGREIFLIGTADEKFRTINLLKFLLHNNEAAKYVTTDKFGRVTISGMSVADWSKKFGGAAAQLGALLDAKYKLGVGVVSADVTGGGGRFVPISKNYGQVLLDERQFPKELFGTMQWLDTTMSHELFGHGAGAAGTLPSDVGSIHFGKGAMFGIGSNEADGMWAENQYRSSVGLPPRKYYAVEGDYIPPKGQ